VRIRLGEEKLAKEKIREFVLSLRVDDVGFATAVDYKSLNPLFWPESCPE